MHKTDFLIVGSGIAGLSLALKLSHYGKVIVLTKTSPDEANTKYAQGGVAAVMDNENDSFEKHIQDTLIAGDGLCHEDIVRIVVSEGPDRIRELIEWGASFSLNDKGELDLVKEGGHSDKRIIHAADYTGKEIENTLLQRVKENPNILLFDHYFAIEILTQHHLGRYVHKGTPNITCYGVFALNKQTEKVEKILSKITVMATGGCGNVYASTTNPKIATGDGIAMVFRANGRIANMEFVQFHPTALYHPGHMSPAFLISEAVRGHGAILRNHEGEAFMQKYDPRKDLAPRDIVARAIDQEMKKHGKEYMYLDATQISPEEIKIAFPTIYQHCLSVGIDMRKEWIPVVPAMHYICGGILVDEHGKTSIHNLYACGECACTGLHGANRLASNSLLEALVFAHRICEHVKNDFKTIPILENIPDWNDSGTTYPEEWILIAQNFKEVQNLMSSYVGIVRNDLRLERTLRRLDLIYKETEEFYKKTKVSVELCELRNIITCAFLITKSAKLRKESRGLHYTTDFSYKNQDYLYDTIL
ncbi:MAG: L-aspartate oxidase [Bacteroidia bacterium]|nr:L-aspartate oxidase [Bacteroidia bacterium]MDW8348192.1 L-aspartate oxidase [Bacteroidia bacterium]